LKLVNNIYNHNTHLHSIFDFFLTSAIESSTVLSRAITPSVIILANYKCNIATSIMPRPPASIPIDPKGRIAPNDLHSNIVLWNKGLD